MSPRPLPYQPPRPTHQLEVAILFSFLCPWSKWEKERDRAKQRKKGEQSWSLLEAKGEWAPNAEQGGSTPYQETEALIRY